MEAGSILVRAVGRAQTSPPDLAEEVALALRRVMFCPNNRAPARLVLACALAKAHLPDVDATEPYTSIHSGHSFSGRTYDERFLSPLIALHRLPLNATTAFLTPTLRNMNAPLRQATVFEGRPREVYQDAAFILERIQAGQLKAEDVLAAALAELLHLRDEREAVLNLAVDSVAVGSVSLSTEDILTLIEQHLSSKWASRLPVLLVAALYQTLGRLAGEQIRTLGAHNAADSQIGSLGDVEVELLSGTGEVVTAYEVKARAVSVGDLQQAVSKILGAPQRPENYLFVTTYPIEREVVDYARTLHD